MKNCLYISYDGMTDPLGQSQVLPYLSGLSSKGYRIHLISAEKPDNYTALKQQIQKICEDNRITWHPVTYSKNPPVIGTILDIRKMFALAKKLHQIHDFRLVHCRSYIAGLVGLKLKASFKIPFLFDMRGLWVDEKVDGNIWNLKNPLYRIIYRYLKKKEKQLLGNANGIISLTHKACPVIHSLNPNKSEDQLLKVIPCCVDVHQFDPSLVTAAQTEEWRKKLNILSNDFVLVYLGSFSTWYLPKEMLLFFKRLHRLKPESKFLIITHENPEQLIVLAKETEVDLNSLIITRAERAALPALLKVAHVSISFIKPAYSKIASSPVKIGELLSMGIPVVCNAGIGDTDEIIRNSGTGVVCPTYDPEAYDRCIQELLQIKTLVSADKIREKAIELFSLEDGVRRYLEVYSSLIH